ncbi:MAG: substrate-binding domain-containing protein [Actinobacteria bacterium]|nr:substrate-binding domain-containing protein [Actinomycetota bacterium]MCG2797036.1 substrate-binding domain-containing protein [Cellulomonas sp.]
MSSPAYPNRARDRARRVALVAAAAALALLGGAAAPASAQYYVIEGDGSTWGQGIVNQWIADATAQGVPVVYVGIGSSGGSKSFADYQDDFAISEIPYQGTDPATGETDSSPWREYAYLPIVAGGTALSYHVEVGGALMRDVRLSGETIARIYANQITNWNDPAIAADNNGRTFPDLTIKPVYRSDGSGTTAQFTAWLDTQYPAIWRTVRADGGSTSNFDPPEGATTFIGENGSDSVADTIAARSGNGTIGYLEYSYALNADTPVLKVLNASGNFVAPTQYSVAVALTTARIDEDATSPGYLTAILDDVYTNPDPRAYPLSSYSYLILPIGADDRRLTTAKRQTLVDFVSHGLCEGQQQAGPYGYAPLPLNLVQAGFDQLAKLKTADPGVDLEHRDVTTCNNPTFVAGDLTANHLADIAPMPEACDLAGAGPCLSGQGDSGAGEVRMTLGVPSATPTTAGLVLSVPTGVGVVLTGRRDPTNTRVTASAAVPTITVVDTRPDDLLTGWQVNAQAQAFTNGTATIDAKYLGWTPALPQIVPEAGGPLFAQAGPAVPSFLNNAAGTGLSVGRLMGRTTSSGRGTTTLGATLDLAVPSSTAEGGYTSTLTITLVAG